jgi:hypothetical protein
VIALCALAFTQRGAFIGVILLATMDGLPYIETSRIIFAKYTIQDAAVCALVLISTIWIFVDNRSYRPSRIGRAVSGLGLLLLFWWLFTLARTVTGEHVPLQHAAAYGREFLYFAVLLLLLPRVRLESRDIKLLLAILALGVCVYAVGQIMIAVGAGNPGSLIHYEKTLSESSLTRVYAKMTDLVGAGLAVSLAAVMLSPVRSMRLIAIPIALLLTISVVVQLTRARWIGLLAGLLIVSLWFLIDRRTSISALLRKRLVLAATTIALVAIVVVVAVPSLLPGATLTHRLLSIVTNLEGNSGTVAVRETASKMVTHYLRGQWALGLGLVPPSFHYFAGLPEGSIRDTDLGVLNAVVTMGVVGAVLVYAPVLLALFQCIRRTPRQQGRHDWLRYGGAIWLGAALISSLTLVTLFSASGLALTAIFLTVLVNPNVAGVLKARATTRPARNFLVLDHSQRRTPAAPASGGG